MSLLGRLWNSLVIIVLQYTSTWSNSPFLLSSLEVVILLTSIQSHVLYLQQFSRALKILSEKSVVDAKNSEDDKGTCRNRGRAGGP